jgi:hypothetical protein
MAEEKKVAAKKAPVKKPATAQKKTVAPKRAAASSARAKKEETAVAVADADVAERAYYLHLEGGHDPHENWVRAERELKGEPKN